LYTLYLIKVNIVEVAVSKERRRRRKGGEGGEEVGGGNKKEGVGTRGRRRKT